MTTASPTEKAIEPAHPQAMICSAFQLLVFALVLTEAALAFVLYHDWFWLAIPLVFVASHFMHGLLIGFHEASHGLLRKNRRFNEFDGVLIGVLSLTSFSLYRAAHQTHHAYLATERDEELWPFVHPSAPRWLRRLAAFLELFVGLLFTPSLFIRTFLRTGSPIRNKKVRRRIWAELILIVVFWAGVVFAVAWFHLWKYFVGMHLAPAIIAANLQSWRKYIEHVGLSGDTANGATPSLSGRLLAFTLLHEPFHGVHHIHVGLPHDELPRHAESLQPANPGERPPFTSYRSALLDLLRNLRDPRVGAQWAGGAANVEEASHS
jgi:fatty acid desaturase